MRPKNFKGGRCIKTKLKKCDEVARTYDKIQTAYAEVLDRDKNIETVRCNVLLENLEDGECAKRKELVIYKCHAGLTEAVVPIMDKGGVLAYVMFGQIIPMETKEETRRNIKKHHPELAGEVDSIPVKSQQELSAAATVLQAITAYVMTNRWVVPNKSAFIREIDRYIEEHLAENITVDAICTAFRIGRTKIYELSASYLGCGLAEYIRKQRISHAQRLLRQTDMSVTDIAFATGFADYNHFSRIFKQTTGLTARSYRNRKDM